MKPQTLKKIIELAYKFDNRTISDLDCVSLDAVSEIITIALEFISIWEHYPLLLRRATERWNEKYPELALEITTDSVYCSENEIGHFLSEFNKTDYLTSQEQAFEACLIELLEE